MSNPPNVGKNLGDPPTYRKAPLAPLAADPSSKAQEKWGDGDWEKDLGNWGGLPRTPGWMGRLQGWNLRDLMQESVRKIELIIYIYISWLSATYLDLPKVSFAHSPGKKTTAAICLASPLASQMRCSMSTILSGLVPSCLIWLGHSAGFCWNYIGTFNVCQDKESRMTEYVVVTLMVSCYGAILEARAGRTAKFWIDIDAPFFSGKPNELRFGMDGIHPNHRFSWENHSKNGV